MSTTHIIGAGLAGLAAAVAVAGTGRKVALYEAAPQAGGRCRSYFDEKLGTTIDNGNHLLMSGNDEALRFVETIGSRDTLVGPDRAAYPFVDVCSGAMWVVRPGASPLPWWLLMRARRVPGTRLADYAGGLRFLTAGPHATVDDVVAPGSTLYERFWEPLAVAALNCAPNAGAAALLRPVLLRTFARGEAFCRPLIATHGLSATFADPALAYLAAHGAEVRFGATVRDIVWRDEGARALQFEGRSVDLAPGDRIIVAVPPAGAQRLLPDLVAPEGSTAIVNAHLKFDAPVDWPWPAPLAGIIGGTAQWLFHRGDIISVTVSAADALAERSSDDIAAEIWGDVARALALDAARKPAIRIVKEKRATFLQTPQQVSRRPGTRTRWRDVFLAGDWTDTGLPATIEGALLSGRKAAQAAMTAR